MSGSLHALARAAGIAIDWVDADGRQQHVSDAVLRKVLGGLGLPAEHAQDIAHSLQVLQTLNSPDRLPPLLTTELGAAVDLGGHFAPGTPAELELENGERLALRLDERGCLPAPQALGYHRLAIGDHALTLAVTPRTCWTVADATGDPAAKVWGLGVQLYGLRRPGDGGLGDTQALESLAHAAAAQGADALAISPVHAMFAADVHRYSPYSPSSRVFRNVLYSAPGSILGEGALRAAIEATGLQAELQRLEQLELVDWPAVAAAKLTLLRRLYEAFCRGGPPQWQDFERFRAAGGESLENHCRFEALHAWQVHRHAAYDWHEWPAPYRDPGSPEVARFAREHAQEVGFHAFCQWLIDRGLDRAQAAARSAGMRIGLIADLAVGADGSGSQAWSRQAELLSQLSVGAPPDVLNRAGQAWGISAFSPWGLRSNGYRAFIEMLRACFSHAGGLRIDHAMGLRRLWVMPSGAKPGEGAYLHYPEQDLLRLLCLESVRHQAIVLGEDLGTVPEGFHEALTERGILGMRVLLFEQDHQRHFRPPQAWPDSALATTTTHDLPTLVGWWEGRDIDWRARIDGVDADTLARQHAERHREREALQRALNAFHGVDLAEPLDKHSLLERSIGFVGSTPAPLVLLPLEDALGLEEQPNLPGTTDEHPNWRRRMPRATGELLEEDATRRRLEILNEARHRAEHTR